MCEKCPAGVQGVAAGHGRPEPAALLVSVLVLVLVRSEPAAGRPRHPQTGP